MSMKFGFAFIAFFAYVCSGFVSESYLNRAMADTQKGGLKETAEKKVREIYPKFVSIVKNGADEGEITEFANKELDTVAISKRFCGAKNEKLIQSIIDFLIWRLKTEAIQSVKEYELAESLTAVEKNNRVDVRCNLNKKGEEPANMTITFTKVDGSLKGIVEMTVLTIPLIEGIKTIVNKFCEKNGIKMNSLKSPEKRAEVCISAIKSFIKSNPRGKSSAS